MEPIWLFLTQKQVQNCLGFPRDFFLINPTEAEEKTGSKHCFLFPLRSLELSQLIKNNQMSEAIFLFITLNTIKYVLFFYCNYMFEVSLSLWFFISLKFHFCLSVPFLFVSVGVVLPRWLLKPDVCQHVSHCHHETIHFLIQLLTSLSHFHVILQPWSTLHTKHKWVEKKKKKDFKYFLW